MKVPAAIFILCASLAVQGCSVRTVFGVKPDDVSHFELGTSRGEVEELLGEPTEDLECPRGSTAKFVYDRGSPPEDHPWVAATFGGFLTLLSFGLSEIDASCLSICQRGILAITFDDDDRVVLLRREAYDVGSNCSSGDGKTFYCRPVQAQASIMDLARPVQGSDDLLIESGCYPDFSGLCQLAHEQDGSAQYHLGAHYRDGLLPVSRSLVQAHKWYSLAMQSGVLYAEDARDKVAGRMSADEIVEAERMMSGWLPNPAECGAEKILNGD